MERLTNKEKEVRQIKRQILREQAKKHGQELTLSIVQQMLQLATAGFGLVAALAWNDAIKQAINSYIKPLVGSENNIFSMLIYAFVVTVLAVTVTLQLTKLKSRLEVPKGKK